MATLRISSVSAGPFRKTTRIARVSASGTALANRTARVSSIRAVGTFAATVKVASINVTGKGANTVRVASIRASGNSGSRKVRLGSIVGRTISSMTLAPFATISAEPYMTAVVAATVLTGVPATWSWRQISGPPVDLTLVGRRASFTAPPSVAGAKIVLGVLATSVDGSRSPEIQAEVDVFPHTFWALQNSAWVPAPLSLLTPTG